MPISGAVSIVDGLQGTEPFPLKSHRCIKISLTLRGTQLSELVRQEKG